MKRGLFRNSLVAFLVFVFFAFFFVRFAKAAYYWWYSLPDGGVFQGCTSYTGTSLPCYGTLELPPSPPPCGLPNKTCQEVRDMITSSEVSGYVPDYLKLGGGVFTKITSSYVGSNRPIFSPETNLLGQSVGAITAWASTSLLNIGLIGFSNKFLDFPDQYLYGSIGFPGRCCNDYHRTYSYMYIPRGWWDFAISINQSSPVSTLFPSFPPPIGGDPNVTPNQSQFPCVYTSVQSACFPGERDAGILPSYLEELCLKCGGSVYGWIGARGSGSSVSDPIRSNVYDSSIYNPSKSLEELFSLYTWREFTKPYVAENIKNQAQQDLDYTYSWVDNQPLNNTDSGGEMTDDNHGSGYFSDPAWTFFQNVVAKININMGGYYYLQTLRFYFFAGKVGGLFHFPPEKIQVFCNDPGSVGKLLGSLSRQSTEQQKTELVVMLDGSVCRNFTITMEPRWDKGEKTVIIAEIDVEGIPRGTSTSAKVDEIWTGPRYYEGGIYPVQFSIDFDRIFRAEDEPVLDFVTKGQRLLWRSYNPATGIYGPVNEYVHGNGLARFFSCGPGSIEVPCKCTLQSVVPFVSGERRDNVLLATLSDNNNSSVTVTSSDNSIIRVISSSVGDNGEVRANLEAGEVDVLKTATLTISSPAADGSGKACGSADVPCSVSVIVRPGKFWQAKDADVIALNDIASYIPEGSYLLTKGSNTSGIAFYNGNIRIGEGSVSESGWGAVKTNIASVYNLYNYSYFEGKVPSEVRNGWGNSQGVINSPVSPLSLSNFTTGNNSILKDNYYWTKVNGDLKISASSGFNQKLVLFVNGDVTVEGDITLATNGNGFLMIVATGDIKIDPSVTRIDGIFLADGSFSTGTEGSRQDSQLIVNGTVVANTVQLQRSLTLDKNPQSTPAELFEYKPNLILSMPYYFYQRSFNWREINP